jgi:hypothetical protein
LIDKLEGNNNGIDHKVDSFRRLTAEFGKMNLNEKVEGFYSSLREAR